MEDDKINKLLNTAKSQSRHSLCLALLALTLVIGSTKAQSENRELLKPIFYIAILGTGIVSMYLDMRSKYNRNRAGKLRDNQK